jgi:hypothetical protein
MYGHCHLNGKIICKQRPPAIQKNKRESTRCSFFLTKTFFFCYLLHSAAFECKGIGTINTVTSQRHPDHSSTKPYSSNSNTIPLHTNLHLPSQTTTLTQHPLHTGFLTNTVSILHTLTLHGTSSAGVGNCFGSGATLRKRRLAEGRTF